VGHRQRVTNPDVSCASLRLGGGIGAGETAHPLLFVQIFARNIILNIQLLHTQTSPHLMRANFLLISVPGVFRARHYVGLERVPFDDVFYYVFEAMAIQSGSPVRNAHGCAREVC